MLFRSFEWEDGNPDDEDRKGKTVVIDNVTGKIRLATNQDNTDDIIGVVSRTYGVILDSQEMDWVGKYQRNEFGEFIKEPVEYVEYYTEEEGERSRPLSEGPVPEGATNVRQFTSMNDVISDCLVT